MRQLMKCLYPREKREVFTKEAMYLQSLFGWVTVIHNVLFVFSLTLIGFLPMVESTLLSLWSYSVYLTMNEW